MENINIEYNTSNRTYLVKADTKRFGIQEIMFEGLNKKECLDYINREGGTYVEELKDYTLEGIKPKTLQYKGMKFRSNHNGTYTVSSDNGKYIDTVATFGAATMWIHEMADNNDIGREFCHRICKAFNCDVYGRICTKA